MLESFSGSLLVGTVLGFLSGLGIGGGSLLILWLTLVLDMPPENARMINLLFFLPSAFVSCLFRWKQGSLNILKILPAIISGCLGALLLAHLGKHTNTELLKKLFGGLLIITGIRELTYKDSKGMN